MAFRLHYEFAGNIAEPTCSAGERNIGQGLIDFDTAVN